MNEGKRNFYFKNGDNTGESIEVYVGQRAGKQLAQDIMRAEREVLIVSPYIDERKLDDLFYLKDRGINIKLVFSDLRESQKIPILKKLIHQQRHIDKALETQVRVKAKKFAIIAYLSLVLSALLFAFTILLFQGFGMQELITSTLGLFTLYLFYLFNKKKDKIEKTNIYRYSYERHLNFKYLRNNFQSEDKMFMHSKIYIIDRKIAYLGSMNFTNNGFNSNFETRVRITRSEKINELVDFVNTIYDDSRTYKAHELWFLGRQVYNEEKSFLAKN